MKENSIEETKKQLELILKVRKEQKEIIECAGGSCMNCDPDIEALSKSIDILSDYKRVLKENEELNLKYYMLYTGKIENLKAQEVKIKNQVIPVQKVKDKIEELNSRIEKYRKYVEQGIETNVEWVDNVADRETVKVLQELLEGRK